MQETHPGRFNQITFSHFSYRVGALDEGTLDRLVGFSKDLTKLTLSYMNITSSENREALVLMTKKILHRRPPLTHLDL